MSKLLQWWWWGSLLILVAWWSDWTAHLTLSLREWGPQILLWNLKAFRIFNKNFVDWIFFAIFKNQNFWDQNLCTKHQTFFNQNCLYQWFLTRSVICQLIFCSHKFLYSNLFEPKSFFFKFFFNTQKTVLTNSFNHRGGGIPKLCFWVRPQTKYFLSWALQT